MTHPRITHFKQAAALSAWLVTLLTGLPILLNGLVTGTFVLPFVLTKAELAWIVGLLPMITLFCSWLIHGLTTNDWSPPALNAILQLFQTTPAPSPVLVAPQERPPSPQPYARRHDPIVLYQDQLASMRPVQPATDEPPPRPVLTQPAPVAYLPGSERLAEGSQPRW